MPMSVPRRTVRGGITQTDFAKQLTRCAPAAHRPGDIMPEYDADVITTYAEMKWWRDRFFAEDGLRFLIVIGSPGSAKTRMFQDGAPPGTLHQSGSLSAFYLYKQLYVHLDDPIVIDDVDGLFKDKAA